MSTEARVRIDSHRLMRNVGDADFAVRIEGARNEIEEQKRMEAKKMKHRTYVHIAVFFASFIFTTGFLVLSILLWVRPDTFFSLVAVSVFSAVIFVTTFSSLRMFILHGFPNKYQNKEEDPGLSHHISKSIVYGFIALVFAIIVTGVLIKIASASTLV